jgi:sulfate transport system ATP-binding protein
MTIEVRNLVKKFGEFAALDGVDLRVADGELLALLGPSGSGKTTLLRIIAGLDWPDSGEIFFDGENALLRKAGERHVGFVFQHYALFRHMTVFENVAFGLRVQPRAVRKDEAGIRARVKELLDLVQLDWLAGRYPSQLSGGQRQRIALARALAVEPEILVADEPVSALDVSVQAQVLALLADLRAKLGLSLIFITHDLRVAANVCDLVAVMQNGKVVESGETARVFANPAHPYTQALLDSIPGRDWNAAPH